MSAKAAPTCPNCQAPLPLGGNASIVTCEYCGRQVMREQPQAPRPPDDAMRRIQQHIQMATTQAPVAKLKGIIIVAAVIPLILGAIIAVVVATKAQKASTRRSSGPGGGGYTPSGEHLQWGDSPPIAVDIDQDGVDDFVGRFRILDGETHVYVGAFDGKTFKRRWKTAPLGTASDYQAIHVAVAGDHVVASDGSNLVHVIELGTGKELRSFRMTDKVETFCPFPEDASKVWIGVADKKDVKLDMATGEIVSFGRPGWCPGEVSLSANSDCWHVTFHRERLAHAECHPAEEAPPLDGFRAEQVLVDGGAQVAVGVKDPGTRIPMLMGFQGSGRSASVTWSRNVGEDADEGSLEVADMIDGRVIIAYETKKGGWRLAALDAASGNTVYDVAIPRSEEGSGPSKMSLTPAQIYVPHWTWLDVFETATGEHLGTVGIW